MLLYIITLLSLFLINNGYGPTDMAPDNAMRGLRCIWISHIDDADHHAGLARILSLRRDLLMKEEPYEPLLVVGPRQLKRYLDMMFLDCWHTTEAS